MIHDYLLRGTWKEIKGEFNIVAAAKRKHKEVISTLKTDQRKLINSEHTVVRPLLTLS